MVALRVVLRGEVLEDRAIGAVVPVTVFSEMGSRIAHRLQLAELSEYALHDIGLSRAQVAAELSKPMWR